VEKKKRQSVETVTASECGRAGDRGIVVGKKKTETVGD